MIKFVGGPWNGKEDTQAADGAVVLATWTVEGGYILTDEDGKPLDDTIELPEESS